MQQNREGVLWYGWSFGCDLLIASVLPARSRSQPVSVRAFRHLVFSFSRPVSTPATIGVPLTFTAVFMPVPEGYIGFVEEIPGANSQGETLDEVRENLREAVQLVLEANRELAEQTLIGQKVEREPFELVS